MFRSFTTYKNIKFRINLSIINNFAGTAAAAQYANSVLREQNEALKKDVRPLLFMHIGITRSHHLKYFSAVLGFEISKKNDYIFK